MKTILFYGFLLAALTALMKFIEYRWLVRDLSLEFYVGIVAVFFTALGIWMGLRLTHKKTAAAATAGEATIPKPPMADEHLLQRSGLSKREHEVLLLMAQGCSNQEIADRLFLSLNTVKTHTSNLFVKLDVKRRTQAVQRAKEIGLVA